MMKLMLIFVVFMASSYADKYNDFLRHLNKKEYESACRVGKQIIYADEKDEKLLSLIAQSCMECDYIYALSMVQHRLRESKDSRRDAVVFSSVVLQKKLIYQFMYDDADISTLALPVIEHPLSHTFVAIRDKNYKVISSNPKVITFNHKDEKYKVYIDKEDEGRIIIEIKDAKGKFQKRRYL